MTSVLTDEERIAIRQATKSKTTGAWSDSLAYSSAIEAATIKRLAAGVSVEPVGECTVPTDTYVVHPGDTVKLIDAYSHDQLQTAIAAARAQENERCLALMDAIGCDWRDAGDMAKFYATNYLCDAIRALLGKEQS